MREADMWVIRCYKDYNLVSAILEINRGGNEHCIKKTMSISGEYLLTRYITFIPLHCDGQRYRIFVQPAEVKMGDHQETRVHAPHLGEYRLPLVPVAS